MAFALLSVWVDPIAPGGAVMAHGPDLHKERHWLGLIRRWQRSQLTAREFCERLGLSEPSFYSWRRLLRQRGLIQDAPPTPPPPTPTFLPLAVAVRNMENSSKPH